MCKILWQFSGREGGDEARLRWGELKLGHAADRECRAVGRARSSSAAPQPEGVAARLWSDESAGERALLRPLSAACTGEKRTRAESVKWKASASLGSGERTRCIAARQNISAGRARSSAKSGPIPIARHEGRRDLRRYIRIGEKSFAEETNRLER